MSGFTGKLKISRGNTKLGPIPNLSLPPVISCRTDAPCVSDCYALKFYRMYPNVRAAWEANLELLVDDPDRFFNDLALYLALCKPARFRLHVAGDFIDEEHFVRTCEVFEAYPNTDVLCFTKQYGMPFEQAPENMKLVLSMWPGLAMPAGAHGMPLAWLEDDDRIDHDEPFILCPGGCIECNYRCWDAVGPDLPVVFRKH